MAAKCDTCGSSVALTDVFCRRCCDPLNIELSASESLLRLLDGFIPEASRLGCNLPNRLPYLDSGLEALSKAAEVLRSRKM
jgi:hypothetical protein